MALTDEQKRARIRRKVGDNDASNEVFSDAELDDILLEAADYYSDEATIIAKASVLAVEALIAGTASNVTYRQGESSENLSDTAKALLELHKRLTSELEKLEDKLETSSKLRLFRRAKRARNIEGANDSHGSTILADD